MAQLTDLDALEANAKRDNPNGSAKSDPPKPGLVEHSAHKEILALVPRLTRYARVLTRDIAAADDLVQDCIARALGKIHLWEQGTDLRAWLFTILHHQHISSARRDARQRASRELWQSHKSLTFLPDQMMRLELRDLQRAMAKLPEEQRSVILLVGRDGLGYNEAASVVNQPVGTVRSRVSRGREALRAMTGSFPSRHSRRPRRAANLPPAARSQRAAQMKISLVAASVISACLAATSVGAQERESWPDAPAACGKPQHVAVGADEQPAARADATGLCHWAYGVAARAPPAEPVGPGPAGAGDRSGAQRLHAALAAKGLTRLPRKAAG